MSAEIERARAVLGNALGISPATIALDATVHDLDGWDSLGHMRIVAAMESETGMILSPEQILGLSSLQDVAEILSKVEK